MNSMILCFIAVVLAVHAEDATTEQTKCDMTKNGAKWWTGSFHYECRVTENMWQQVVVDCRTPDLTPIGVGNTVTVGKCQHTCEQLPNGGLHTKIQCAVPANSDAPCNLTSQGHRFWIEQYQFECQVNGLKWHTTLVDCRTPKFTPIGVGQTMSEDGCEFTCKAMGTQLGIERKCVKVTKAPVILPSIDETNELVTRTPPVVDNRHQTAAEKCNMNKNGNTWWMGQFKYICVVGETGWRANLIACKTPGQTEIIADNEVVEDLCAYKCASKADGGLRLDVTCDRPMTVGPTTTQAPDSTAAPTTSSVQVTRASRSTAEVSTVTTPSPNSAPGCDMSKDGNTWWVNDFQMRCVVASGGWKSIVEDCRTPVGKLPIGKGNELVEGRCTYRCDVDDTQQLRISSQCQRATTVRPVDNGSTAPVGGGSGNCNANKDGHTWWEGQWEHQCVVTDSADGMRTWTDSVINCRTRMDTVIGVGKTVAEKGCTTRCFTDTNGSLRMSTRGTCQ